MSSEPLPPSSSDPGYLSFISGGVGLNPTGGLPSRITERVDQTGGPDACHEWQGARLPKPNYPYGVVGWEGKVVRVHRLLWIVEHGVTPGETPFVLHRCDNPPCCNVRHLFLGTHQDNMDDMAAKGRRALGGHDHPMPRGDDHWTRRSPEQVIRGHDRPESRFTPEQIVAIRAVPKTYGVIAKLAREYGVSHTTISKIRRGARY